MDENSGKTMKNPVDYMGVLALAPMVLTSIFLGVFIYADSGARFFGSILLLLMGLASLLVLIYKVFIHNPNSVIIGNDGLIMNFRFSSSREYLWEDIECMNILDNLPESNFRIKGEFAGYSVILAIGGDMKEAYLIKLGEYPPEGSEGKR